MFLGANPMDLKRGIDKACLCLDSRKLDELITQQALKDLDEQPKDRFTNLVFSWIFNLFWRIKF